MPVANKKPLFIVILLGTIVLLFTVADFFNKDRLFSEAENRVLAKKPELSAKKLLDGAYSMAYEDYVSDQFIGRDIWISIKTRLDMAIGKKVINGIYLAKDDYLIEQHKPGSISEEIISKKVSILDNFLSEFPEADVLLVPTADNILTDKLPSHKISYDQKAFTESLKTSLTINIFDTLLSHKNEDIYYKTDHHWTSLGAYYAYLEWATKNGVTPIRYDTSRMTTVTNDFYGTLHSKINIPVKPDEIKIFRETLDYNVTIEYDNSRKSDSLYEESYLKTKNKYGYFLDDNHGIVKITNNDNNTGKSLCIIKDSYANTFIPLIVPHYETIYVIDPRYHNDDIANFIKKIEKTDTLILYNCIHFLEDFKL